MIGMQQPRAFLSQAILAAVAGCTTSEVPQETHVEQKDSVVTAQSAAKEQTSTVFRAGREQSSFDEKMRQLDETILQIPRIQERSTIMLQAIFRQQERSAVGIQELFRHLREGEFIEPYKQHEFKTIQAILKRAKESVGEDLFISGGFSGEYLRSETPTVTLSSDSCLIEIDFSFVYQCDKKSHTVKIAGAIQRAGSIERFQMWDNGRELRLHEQGTVSETLERIVLESIPQ